MGTHFFYSHKAELNKCTDRNLKNYALINGKEVAYTFMGSSSKLSPDYMWDDIIYLGEGKYLKSVRMW